MEYNRQLPPMILADKDDILAFLLEKGVSFTSEISRELNVNFEDVNKSLTQFKNLGFIKKIIPNPEDPQPVFKGRMQEMWAQGIIGYVSFAQRSWWMLTLPGIEYCLAKFKGRNKRIKNSLLMMYCELITADEVLGEVSTGKNKGVLKYRDI